MYFENYMYVGLNCVIRYVAMDHWISLNAGFHNAVLSE